MDEDAALGATCWAVDTTADRAVAERIAGTSVAGAAAQAGLVRVLELVEGEEADVPSLRFVRIALTLGQAFDDVAPDDAPARSTLIDLFAKLCETLGRAHESGITHGPLRPSVVALTDQGDVVIRDWELATFADGATPTEDRWSAYLAPYREAADVRVVPGGLEALSYLPPETLRGEIAERDEAADVYALGAILYRILTGFVPYAFQTFDELLAKSGSEDVQRASHLAPDAPGPLSALAARCLSRDPAERPVNSDDIARAVRVWQAARRSAEDAIVEREAITQLVTGVREFGGDEGPRRLDEAIARTRALLKENAGDEEASALRAEAEQMRESLRQAARAEKERSKAELERAWADATEARSLLVRTEAEIEESKQSAVVAEGKLARVRDDLTRARAEVAHSQRELERKRQERIRAVTKAVEVERDNRSRLVLTLGVVIAILVLVLLGGLAFVVFGGGSPSRHARLDDAGPVPAHVWSPGGGGLCG